MKTKILLALPFLLLTLPGLAQSDSAKFEYCELIGSQKAFSMKYTIQVDFGEERNYWKDPRMKDEQTGKIKTFNSMVDALNYMAKDGWEFVQGYGISGANGMVYKWLLRKENK